MSDRKAEDTARSKIVERITRRCRHFNGLAHSRCKARLRYADIVGADTINANGHVPCIGRHAEDCGHECPARSPYTLEEAKKAFAHHDAIAARYHERLRMERKERLEKVMADEAKREAAENWA